MSRAPLAVLLLIALALLAPASPGQNVLVVDALGGPGFDFQNLNTAIDAAADGDILLVRGGSYFGTGFPIFEPTLVDGKSLTIQADVGPPAVTLLHGLRIRNLAADQHVVVRGVTLGCDAQLFLEDSAGAIVFEDTYVNGQCNPLESKTTALVEHCDQVVFQRCTVEGGFTSVFAETTANAVNAIQSKLHVYDSTISGGRSNGPSPSGYGLRMQGGLLMASGSLIEGGGLWPGVPCGGAGLWLAAGFPQAFLLETSVLGGEGGCGLDALQVDAGVVQVIAEPARSFELSSPLRAGLDDAQIEFHGEPGELVILYLGLEPLAFFKLGLGGTFQVGLPLLTALVVGNLPPTGEIVLDVPTGPLPVGLDGLTLFGQAGYSQASGHLVLGGGSMQLWLGAGF